MKGTKLWNQPRSPLIQGRSRRERPFWSDWLVATVCGVALGLGVAAALILLNAVDVAAGTEGVALYGLVAAAVGSAAGVRMASAFGWHPRWVGGGVIGGACAVLAAAAVLAL